MQTLFISLILVLSVQLMAGQSDYLTGRRFGMGKTPDVIMKISADGKFFEAEARPQDHIDLAAVVPGLRALGLRKVSSLSLRFPIQTCGFADRLYVSCSSTHGGIAKMTIRHELGVLSVSTNDSRLERLQLFVGENETYPQLYEWHLEGLVNFPNIRTFISHSGLSL